MARKNYTPTKKSVVDPETLNTYSVAELKSYIKNASKKANINLKQLEEAGADAGSRAYRYLESLKHDQDSALQSDGVRFKTGVEGLSRNELLHRATTISEFTSAKTHTVKGVNRAYEKGYKTAIHNQAVKKAGRGARPAKIREIERELSEKISRSQFNEAWGNKIVQDYKKKYGSAVIYDLITAGASGEQLEEAMQDLNYLEGEISAQDLADYVDVDLNIGESEEEDNPFLG